MAGTTFAAFMLTATSSLANTEAAASTQSVDLSYRSEKKLGAYLGILGDPAPTVVGVNVAYNVAEYLRVTAGYGEITRSSGSFDSNGSLSFEESGKLSTFGLGARAMVPGWNLTPVVGVSVGYMSLSGTFTEMQGLTKSGINPYGKV